MNEVISAVYKKFTGDGVECRIPENNEDTVWINTKLPDHEKLVTLCAGYNPQNGVGTVVITGAASFKAVGKELFLFINDFNANPQSFAFKTFLDGGGELVFSTASIIGENALHKLLLYIELGISCVNGSYGKLREITADRR